MPFPGPPDRLDDDLRATAGWGAPWWVWLGGGGVLVALFGCVNLGLLLYSGGRPVRHPHAACVRGWDAPPAAVPAGR